MKNTITLSNGETFRFALTMGALMNAEKKIGGSFDKGLKNSPINTIISLIAFVLVNVKTNKPMGMYAAEKLEMEDIVVASEFVKEQMAATGSLKVQKM